jgi:hypothetical protein
VTGTEVALEVGRRRTFARALDWPGWCRAGRDGDAALAALDAARPRYQLIAARAGRTIPARGAFLVVETVEGDGTTDFGAPGRVAEGDRRPLVAGEAVRQGELLRAVWAHFDAVVAAAPETLRPGPRGDGRDRAALAAHVREAEWSYARKIGLRLPSPATDAVLRVLRSGILDVLAVASDGKPVTDKGWPSRYAAARIAWHVLDHTWEIEERSS